MDDWLDDIFDIFDDEDDDIEKNDQKRETSSDDMTILDEYNEDFDFNLMHTNLDDEEMVMTNAMKMVTVEEKERDSKTVNHNCCFLQSYIN